MKHRKNHQTLDNSINKYQGKISCCKFNKKGNKLAVGDEEGNVCIYETELDNNTKCLGEFGVKNGQMNRKNSTKIKSLDWIQINGQQNHLVTHQKNSIQIWKCQFENQIHNRFQQLKRNIKNLCQESQYFVAHKITDIKIECQSIQGSPYSEELMVKNKETISLVDIQKQVTTYKIVVNSQQILPLGKRNFQQTKLQYQERISSEIEYWNQIALITAIKMNPYKKYIIGQSEKCGDINLFDSRMLPVINDPIIKISNSNRRSTVESCLNIPSDFCFLNNDQILSRDFLYVYLWDIRNPKKYLHKQSIYPSINTQICNMYQQGQIFNRFKLKSNSTGSRIYTTNFQQSFHQIKIDTLQSKSPLNTNTRYICQGYGYEQQHVQFCSQIPPLYNTEVLDNFDYNQNNNLVCACVGSSIKLFKQVSQ